MLASYRLVPEHPFPAAVEDGLAAYAALRARGPVVLSGDSAGGGLVFTVLHAARDAGLADPVACAAFSPWADLSLSGDSLRRNASRDAMLPAERLAEVAERYLDGADPTDPRASPIYMTLDRPPPPAFIAHASTEILADDATALAATLRRHGGAVTEEVHATAPHAWPIFAGRLREADETIARAGAFLRDRLAASTG
jgi:acetyl esterase/lipase